MPKSQPTQLATGYWLLSAGRLAAETVSGERRILNTRDSAGDCDMFANANLRPVGEPKSALD